MYILVLDGRKGRVDEDAEYWLKFIKTFGGGSPTIIVMNKQKLHPYNLNQRALDEFAPEKCLNFRYEYKILPEGLLPRFIVRTYTLSEHQKRWKTGVVLEWEGCRALIEADKSERQVIIRVNGEKENRKRLLSVIRSNFDHIHHEMREFIPVEWIAHEDHPFEWVDYHDLEVHAREGKKEYSKSIGNELVKMNPAKIIDESDVKGVWKREEFDQIHRERGEEPLKAFIIYSHKDDYWRDKLQSNLEILIWERIIEVWFDQRLIPGDEWDETIMSKLEESHIVLLLVSTPMLASKYIREKELPKALELHKSGKARVIPVIISSCSWDKTPLKKLQALPKGGRDIKKPPNKDKACLEVEEGIRKAAENITTGK